MTTTSIAPARGVLRVAVAAYIGTTIEWYDFFIYGIAATLVFRTQFFPGLSELGGTLAALSTFAVGFLARPFGGVIMGHFGDRVGRKAMLVTSLMTMGVATTLIGVLPTAAVIGVWAPILLVVLRLAQGVGVGGEWAGAVLMSIESAPPNRRSLYGCFPQLGLPTGIMLSQLSFLVLTALISTEAFLHWGWRIAFLASAALVVVGIVIRLRIEETVTFERARTEGAISRWPIVAVVRGHWRGLIVGSLITIAGPTNGYMVSVYMVQYGTGTLSLPNTTLLWVVTAVSALWVVFMLLGGLAGDLLGRRRTFLIGAALVVAWAFPMFLLIDTRAIPLIAVALVVMVFCNSIMTGPQPALLAEMFPTQVRYSGASLCYQIGSIIGGGLAPLAATALLARTGSSLSTSTLVAVLSAVSLVAMALVSQAVLRPSAASIGEPEARVV